MCYFEGTVVLYFARTFSSKCSVQKPFFLSKPCLVMNFYSVGVMHVELKRDNLIFREACSVTFDPVREDGETGKTESQKTQISTASAINCLWKCSVHKKQD